MFFHRGGWSIVLGLLYAVSAAVGAGTVAADVARLPIADAWLERLLRIAFFGMAVALLIGLPVAASQI